MNRRRGHAEEALHVALGRWASVDQAIGPNEDEILPLLIGEAGARINWMFSTEQARIKMAKAYPKPTAKES